MQCSELLLEPFSSAAASCACEQCCCVTHMQLPEMLCNGRWQEGEPSGVSQPAEGPGGLLQSREGCALQELSPWPLEESLPEANWAAPRLLPPTTTAIGEPGRPRGRCWQAPARGREGGKALTHSATGPAFVLVSQSTPFPSGSPLIVSDAS